MKYPAKILILFTCFLAFSLHTVVANDTIRMVKASHGGYYSMTINATAGKQFTVDWGDGSPINTYTGAIGDPRHTYSAAGRYKITVAASSEDCLFPHISCDRIDTIDLSSCPSIEYVSSITTSPYLRSLNVRNCVNLETIDVGGIAGGNILNYLDLRDNIALKDLRCSRNAITRIDLVAIDRISCYENSLPLSELYKISEMISNPSYKFLGMQTFSRRAVIGDPVDFSDQKEFGGISTVFWVERSGNLAPQSDYTMEEGIITFHRTGTYKVTMTNAAIVSHPVRPAVVVASVIVVNPFVPVSEIINVPTTAVAGKMLTLSGKVVPSNATNQGISWSIYDAGTTGATNNFFQLFTTAPGTVVVTATIKNGLAIDSAYTQNFAIKVEPVGIIEPAQEISNIKVYPNPTTGILEIETGDLIIHKIEILDIGGRVVAARPFNILSAQHIMDISHLKAGAYFVKIITKQGEVVRKVVKQ